LQARGAYKEVPRASRRLALATPRAPRRVTRVRDKRSLTVRGIIVLRVLVSILASYIYILGYLLGYYLVEPIF